ncbi:hypothetical protein [Cupriavidus campinensis]|uniref:Uncharacterized protein n=1 Tax=Cupriavidus campinensis TaxID=151783 RepID=A0AAE9HWN0_9BURK|nr:hypothetical protein [Cupriavidus campinensis]URF03009.1 hypothetical protein M5D45_10620 [Cupriavidus campinensis]
MSNEKNTEGASLAQKLTAAAYRAGVEAAAKWIDERRESFDRDHGSIDPETGTMEYGSGARAVAKSEYSYELYEIAEGIRALVGAPTAADAENTAPITANPAEIAPATLPYPTEPTDALLEVLGLMLYTTTPIAHALRAAGTDIPKRCEEEQAHVLHWLVQLALQHGAEWRARAAKSIEELQAATQATSEVRA